MNFKASKSNRWKIDKKRQQGMRSFSRENTASAAAEALRHSSGCGSNRQHDLTSEMVDAPTKDMGGTFAVNNARRARAAVLASTQLQGYVDKKHMRERKLYFMVCLT